MSFKKNDLRSFKNFVSLIIEGSVLVQVSSRFVADLKALADLQRNLNEIDQGLREHNRKFSEEI